jgi:hypothetical protein
VKKTVTTQEVTQKAVETVRAFFADHIDDDQAFLPEVLQSTGIWMAICSEQVLSIFFLNEKEQQRIDLCKHKGVHPFPGFMIGESERPSDQRASYSVTSPFRFYSSKRSSDTFAFTLSRGASCIVTDHVHEIADSSGKKSSYAVDLVFMLGRDEYDSWAELEPRLASLLDYCLEVWRRS